LDWALDGAGIFVPGEEGVPMAEKIEAEIVADVLTKLAVKEGGVVQEHDLIAVVE
jgi:hypothetical protein